MRRRLVEVGPEELAFDERDAARLFSELDVDLASSEVARLVEHTEGWPVALYLAVLACGTGRASAPTILEAVSGEHRLLVDYLSEELLDEADPDVASFLLEASCFERMSGSLCDAALQHTGSARRLEELQRRNQLIIALDDHREWYRFHHLFAEFLRSELARRNPSRRSVIHRRASDWFDAHGDPDGAVSHAVLGGDVDRAEAMVLRWYGTAATAGRGHPVTERWVGLFPPQELLARPLLMVVTAWARFAAGDPGAAVHWLTRAGSAVPERHPHNVKGLVAPVSLALARSIIAPLSPDEMMNEATYVYDRVGVEEGHPLACLARGAAAFTIGDEPAAASWFEEGAGTPLDRPVVVASCLAHRAILDIEHGRWHEAATTARRARALIADAAPFVSMALVLAVSVLIETQAGRANDAEADRQLCRQHLTRLINVAPWLNIQSRLALARAAAIRGDRIEAVALLDEAAAIVAQIPSAIGPAEQLAGLRRGIVTRQSPPNFGPSSLTTAELRVLQLLPTHLSFAAIAERLYVSRNTVKSQAIAIYRKLGTTTRSEAVDAAVAAGLAHDVARRDQDSTNRQHRTAAPHG